MPRKSKAGSKKPAKNFHVLPRSKSWVIVIEGSQKPSSVHETQIEAVEADRRVARRLSGQLVVHGRDGRIRARDSYSSDPLPPRKPRKVLRPTAPPRTASRKAISRAVIEAVREAHSNSQLEQAD